MNLEEMKALATDKDSIKIAKGAARAIMAAIGATKGQAITKRQKEEWPSVVKLGARHGNRIPIAHGLTRLNRRVLPGLFYRGLVRWGVDENGVYIEVKEPGES